MHFSASLFLVPNSESASHKILQTIKNELNVIPKKIWKLLKDDRSQIGLLIDRDIWIVRLAIDSLLNISGNKCTTNMTGKCHGGQAESCLSTISLPYISGFYGVNIGYQTELMFYALYQRKSTMHSV